MTLKNNNFLGLILIGIGVMAILGNIGFLGGMPNLLFAAGMGIGGIYLARQYLKGGLELWASIVGFVMMGLALASITGKMAGFYFFVMIAAGFINIYRKETRHWWALIPGGVLLTLGIVAGSEAMFPRWDAAPLFFAGLAGTFGYLYTLNKRWAMYPAIALAIVAFLNLSFSGGWVVPALLIGLGIYVINRQKKARVFETSSKPVEPLGKDVLIRKLDDLAEVSPAVTTNANVNTSDQEPKV